MIKNISGSSRYVVVNGGMPTSTYINSYQGSQGVGNVRYNTSGQYFEVYDGSTWIQLTSGYATVGLTRDAEELLDWAKMKKLEEENLKYLAQSNTTIADLINQKKEIDEKIKMVQILTKEENKVG